MLRVAVIFDADAWVHNLPRTIMAVFVFKGADRASNEFSRGVHAAFLRTFRITSAETPLVTYDPTRGVGRHFELWEPG